MIDQLIKHYEKSPIIHGLAQLLSPVAAADAALTIHIQNIRESKMRAFFDELEKGTKDLTPDLIQKDDFLHAFFATCQAVLHTRRIEKVQFLAQLLAGFGARESEEVYPIDEYEEYLFTIDEMSWREIIILSTLAECEQQFPKDKFLNNQERMNQLWPTFTQRIVKEQSISEKEISSILLRLMRTGFYQPNIGGYGSSGLENASGKLTDGFYRFLEQFKEHRASPNSR